LTSCIIILACSLDVCEECGHVVATHKYTFSCDRETQVTQQNSSDLAYFFTSLLLQDYSMECNLCGHGEDTVTVIPDDQFMWKYWKTKPLHLLLYST